MVDWGDCCLGIGNCCLMVESNSRCALLVCICKRLGNDLATMLELCKGHTSNTSQSAVCKTIAMRCAYLRLRNDQRRSKADNVVMGLLGKQALVHHCIANVLGTHL
jgi:hypothetical protein